MVFDIDRDDIPYQDDDAGYSERLRVLHSTAHDSLLDLIGREHAVVWAEVEAKLADRPQPPLAPFGINPHLLTSARRQLVERQWIEAVSEETKGGSRITVYGLKDRRGRKTEFTRAARRKRPLHARYLSWAGTTKVIPNLIGEGGELVVRATLQEMASAGVCVPVGGAIRDLTALFDQPVAGGALDAAAFYPLVDHTTDVLRTVTAIIEVKNLREHIYPATEELFQLLDKAARLQINWPTRSFLPVLICRRAHYLTFVMAKHLGFFVIEFGTKLSGWIQPLKRHHRVSEQDILEVREELGYQVGTMEQPNNHMRRQFREAIPRQAISAADRWALTAPTLSAHYTSLRRPTLSTKQREVAMDGLYRAACRIVQPAKSWRQRLDHQDEVPF